MQWIIVFAVTFSTVFIAELGDKSQLITISLASKYDRKKIVFLGLLLGTSTVTILSVALGSLVFGFVDVFIVKIIASFIFVFFGIFTLFKSKKKESSFDKKTEGAFMSPFVLSILAEFGDKTQLAIIALTARYSSPLPVFFGAVAGLGVITAMGVLLGSVVGKFFENEKIDILTGIIFITIGVLFMVEAVFF